MLKYGLLFIALSILLFSFDAQARQNTVYHAKVAVDVTAVNASQARQRAMDEASRRAFLSVAKKISSAEGVEKLSQLNNNQVANFIKEIDIVEEKSSDVRYIATLNISINGDLLKEYMQEEGIPFMFDSKAKAVVIPVFQEFPAAPPMLWERENVWRAAWETRPYKVEQISFSPLVSDAANYGAMDAVKAITLDGRAFEAVSQNTETKNIYVALAQSNGINSMTVDISSLQSGLIGSFEVSGNAQNSDVLEGAIQKAIEIIRNDLEKRNITESNSMSELNVLYQYDTLREWLALEQKLKSIRYIDELQVGAMGSGKVQFKIHYLGSMDTLLSALHKNSLNLKPNGPIYLLERL